MHISNRYFFLTSICRRFFTSLAILLLLVTCAANAGPWIEVGDSQLRSDIQILADAGVIRGPVSTWPLAWGNIVNDLDTSVSLKPFEMAALARVRRESRRQMVVGEVHLDGRIALSDSAIEIRSFEDTPREHSEIELSASWTGDNTAMNFQITKVDDPLDGKKWRGDGSYFGISVGNWMYSISAQDRWWGPGWQGSLIMSNNARPIPALVIDRNSTRPFKTKWLSWMGPWDLYMMWGELENDRDVPNANFFGARLSFKPIPSLEIGLSRTAQLCGDGRPCGSGVIEDMLLGRDNREDNVSAEEEPGNQLGGFDIRWSGKAFEQPLAIYTQWIGEDEGGQLPAKYMGQIGFETWGQSDKWGTYRFYLEWSDTTCNFALYKGNDNTVQDCAYNHTIYTSGYRRYGRSIGHTFDNDARIFTLGGMLTDHKNNDWSFRLGVGNFNRKDNPKHRKPEINLNTVASVKTEYREIELGHKRDIGIGSIRLGLGYDYRKDTVTGIDTEDTRAFIDWSVPIY